MKITKKKNGMITMTATKKGDGKALLNFLRSMAESAEQESQENKNNKEKK